MLQFQRLFVAVPLFLLAVFSCQPGISQYKLNEGEFRKKIEATANVQLIDVRTPEEYAGGHLKDAVNFDWNDPSFDDRVKRDLDKTSPVYVYCLSGGRSSSAAESMRRNGFKEVYELQGGIMKWRGAGLPEVDNSSSKGMTEQQYNTLLNTDKIALVDFNAPWCKPCKEMAPMLEEIAKQNIDKLELLPVNADKNQQMVRTLKVDALPTLIIYKKGKIIWRHTGLISKEDLMKELKL